jgi:hypothetical protein
MEVPSPAGETSRVIESEVVIEAEKAETEVLVKRDGATNDVINRAKP